MLVAPIDYMFARARQGTKRATVTACDVITGRVMCIAVRSKEVSRCRVVALKNLFRSQEGLAPCFRATTKLAPENV